MISDDEGLEWLLRFIGPEDAMAETIRAVHRERGAGAFQTVLRERGESREGGCPEAPGEGAGSRSRRAGSRERLGPPGEHATDSLPSPTPAWSRSLPPERRALGRLPEPVRYALRDGPVGWGAPSREHEPVGRAPRRSVTCPVCRSRIEIES